MSHLIKIEFKTDKSFHHHFHQLVLLFKSYRRNVPYLWLCDVCMCSHKNQNQIAAISGNDNNVMQSVVGHTTIRLLAAAAAAAATAVSSLSKVNVVQHTYQWHLHLD